MLVVHRCENDDRGKLSFRFYPESENGREYVEGGPSNLTWDAFSCMSFEQENERICFSLEYAVGIDFTCVTPILKPVMLGLGFDELFLSVLNHMYAEAEKELGAEMVALRLFDTSETHDQRRREALKGVIIERLRRLRAAGVELSGPTLSR